MALGIYICYNFFIWGWRIIALNSSTAEVLWIFNVSNKRKSKYCLLAVMFDSCTAQLRRIFWLLHPENLKFSSMPPAEPLRLHDSITSLHWNLVWLWRQLFAFSRVVQTDSEFSIWQTSPQPLCPRLFKILGNMPFA